MQVVFRRILRWLTFSLALLVLLTVVSRHTTIGPRVMRVIDPAVGAEATIHAATCERQAVVDALNLAQAGDTVTVPAGTCNWGSAISINKAITLQGAGRNSTFITGNANVGNLTARLMVWTTPSTGTPRLTGFNFASTSAATWTSGAILIIIRGTNANMRVDNNEIHANRSRGIHFGEYVRGVADHNLIYMDCVNQSGGGCFGFRNTGERWTGVAESWCSGFVNAPVSGCGDRSWAEAVVHGSQDFMVYEDNQFIKTFNHFLAIHDGDVGMRAIFRNNVYTNARWGDHGTETDGRYRGDRYTEHYRNRFEYTSLATWVSGNASVISIRSGSHKIFDNTITVTGVGPPTRLFDMATYRRDDGTGGWRAMRTWGRCGAKAVTLTRSGTTATGTTGSGANSHGVCTAGSRVRIAGAGAPFDGDFTAVSTQGCGNQSTVLTFTYTVPNSGSTSSSGTVSSPFDENTDATGYRCMDQAGAGQTVLFTEALPTNSSSGTQLEPIYHWNNLRDSDSTSGTTYAQTNAAISASGQVTTTTVANRDYYNYTASFTGATGIGRGQRTSRPETCTTGVAYWSTDQGTWNTESAADHNAHDPNNLTHTVGEDGVLDKCTSTNTWTNAWYTPLAYPHPLVAGAPPPNSAPQVSVLTPSANFDTFASTQDFSVQCTDDVSCTAITYACSPACGSGTMSGVNPGTLTAASIPAGVSTWTFTGSDGTLTTDVVTKVYRVTQAAAIPFTENFTTGENWPSLGKNWTHYGSTANNFGISSNASIVNNTSFDIEAFTGFAPLNQDQCIKATIVDVSNVIPTKRARVCVNVTGTPGQNNNLNGYCAQADATGSSTNTIFRYDNGALTTNYFPSGLTNFTVTENSTTLKLCRAGSDLQYYIDDVLIASAPIVGTPLTGGTVGIASVGVGAAIDTIIIDNLNVEVDTEDPVVSIDTPTEDEAYEFSGTSFASLEADVSDDTGVVSCTVDNSVLPGPIAMSLGGGKATTTNIPMQENIQQILTVTCLDAAGNDGSDTLTVNPPSVDPPPDPEVPVPPNSLRGIF